MSFGFGDICTYENSSGNQVLSVGRQIDVEDLKTKVGTPALRTFLQLTINRTVNEIPSKSYEKPSFFRQKENREKSIFRKRQI